MKQVVIENPVPKPVRPGDCLLSRMFSSRARGGLTGKLIGAAGYPERYALSEQVQP